MLVGVRISFPCGGSCNTGDLPHSRVDVGNASELKPGANRQCHFKIFHSAVEIIGTASFSKCKVVAMEDRKSLVCTEKENIGNCPTVKHSCLCAGRGVLASTGCFPKVSVLSADLCTFAPSLCTSCVFEEAMDKGSGSSWLGLVLSALINVRSRRDFLLGVRYLANLHDLPL